MNSFQEQLRRWGFRPIGPGGHPLPEDQEKKPEQSPPDGKPTSREMARIILGHKDFEH
jgi:hypothetical protein